MSERPYICETGHELANGVTTCPRCGTRAKPARRDPSFYAVLALVVVALVGGAATLIGRDGGAEAVDDADDVATAPPPSWVDDPTTTTAEPVPASTSTTVAATTSTAPTTTAAPSSTTVPSPPTTTATTVAPTPPTTAPRPEPTPRPTTTTPEQLSPADRLELARRAAVVAYTTGHRPSGGGTVETLIAPPLRDRLDELTMSDGYRRAGCRQRVTRILAGPVSGNRYEFSITLDRTCDTAPTENGYRLPLTGGAYATVTLGPRPGGSFWATDLTPDR